jgi:hypothetical protein
VFPLLVPAAAALARPRNRTRAVVVLSVTTAFSAGYGLFLVCISHSSL